MKITVKPLKGDNFQVEAEPSEKVEDVKKKIAAVRPEFPAESQKLIYSGRILTDEKTVQEVGIQDSEFLVVMAKAKPCAAAAQEATATPAAAPSPTATPAAATAPAADAPTAIDQASAAVIGSGAAAEATISQLMEMGFSRPEVERCLSAAFGNPDRAVEYLMSGIPEGILEPAAGAPPPAGGAPPAAPTAGGGASPFPAMTGGGGGGGGGTGGAATAIAELRNHPRFPELAQMVVANPSMLPQILGVLAQQNPGLMQSIQQNPEEFMRMLQDAVQGAGGGGAGQDPVAAMLAAAQQANAGGGGGGGAPGGGAPPGVATIRLTEEERAAVERLAGLGFDPQAALQAYLACDKNEDMAANFLFDSPMED